jgi:hypothetical protein
MVFPVAFDRVINHTKLLRRLVPPTNQKRAADFYVLSLCLQAFRIAFDCGGEVVEMPLEGGTYDA